MKAKRSKNITILLVPDDHSKVFSVKMGAVFFLVMFALWAASVIVSGVIISRHADYRATKEMNKYLEIKNREFAQEVLIVRDTVKRVEEVDSQLRDLLQLKSKSAIIKYTGFGGPSYLDTKLLEKHINSNEDNISRKSFELAVRYIDEQASSNEKSFQEIVKYITDQRAKLTAVPAGWPVKGWITAGFGSRIDPFSGALSFHQGVDIANDEGTPIKATADGVVAFSGFEKGYGNLVTMNHGNGYSTRYGHMQRAACSAGDNVKSGQVIGFLGSTGRSTAPHLHYEVILNGVVVSPVKYLDRKVALK